MTRIYPCSRYASISTVLRERKNHAIYSVFREINFAKIFVKWISRKKPAGGRVCIAILGYCKLLVATSSPE